MTKFSALKLTGLALVTAFYFAAPHNLTATKIAMAADGHDHGKGHSDGDGHKHDDKHMSHGDKHHDGGHETAKTHAKHHPKPSHGGVVLELGEHHGELVVSEGKLALYLSDHDGHKAPAKGFSATAMILTAQGRHGPLALALSGDNRLEANTSATIGSGARVVLTLKDPHGHMTQARYQMP